MSETIRNWNMTVCGNRSLNAWRNYFLAWWKNQNSIDLEKTHGRISESKLRVFLFVFVPIANLKLRFLKKLEFSIHQNSSSQYCSFLTVSTFQSSSFIWLSSLFRLEVCVKHLCVNTTSCGTNFFNLKFFSNEVPLPVDAYECELITVMLRLFNASAISHRNKWGFGGKQGSSQDGNRFFWARI